MDANAINAIQDKLRRQANALSQAGIDVPIDWPPAQPVRVRRSAAAISTPGADYSATIQTLKQRSSKLFSVTRGGCPTSPPPVSLGAQPTASGTSYQDQLRLFVEKINALSLEQERSIFELCRIYAQWSRPQPSGAGPSSDAQSLPQIHWDSAVLASAHLDATGNLVLAYKPVDLQQPQQDAHELAAHLRGTYGARTLTQPSWRKSVISELATLGQEPRQAMGFLWDFIQRGLTAARNGRPRLAQWRVHQTYPLSVLEAVSWGMGGVISRAALDLLLAALPQLGTFAVIAIAAATAYALYRATFAPKPNLGMAMRMLLAVGGLVVGGPL